MCSFFYASSNRVWWHNHNPYNCCNHWKFYSTQHYNYSLLFIYIELNVCVRTPLPLLRWISFTRTQSRSIPQKRVTASKQDNEFKLSVVSDMHFPLSPVCVPFPSGEISTTLLFLSLKIYDIKHKKHSQNTITSSTWVIQIYVFDNINLV